MAPEFSPRQPDRPGPGSAGHDGNTSLKWGSNGELSPVDLQRVLERLTDPSLTRCQLDETS
jgi:hypothetical protein